MPYFGQEIFERAQLRGPLTRAKYIEALARQHRRARTEGIDAVMDRYRLDALVAPTQGPPRTIDLALGDAGDDGAHFARGGIGISARDGARGLRVRVACWSFVLWSSVERGTLIRLAYAFEQATHARVAPKFLATADLR